METKNILGNKKKKTTWNKKIMEQIFCDRRNKSIRTKEQITYCMETKNSYGTKRRKQPETKKLWNKFSVIGGTNL
jgi:hypothetical protein